MVGVGGVQDGWNEEAARKVLREAEEDPNKHAEDERSECASADPLEGKMLPDEQQRDDHGKLDDEELDIGSLEERELEGVYRKGEVIDDLVSLEEGVGEEDAEDD